MKCNKTILVTGANSGVGYCMCKFFASQGHSVIGISKSINNLQKLDIPKFYYYKLDIRKKYDIIDVVNDIIEKHKIDVLINSAAVFESIELSEQTYESMENIIDTNLKGTIMMTRAILPSMLVAGRGKIINISSVSGCHGIEKQSVYSATKHALMGFSESLNHELIPLGMQIVNICPGGINTELWNSENPYTGDKSLLLSPMDIAEMAHYIIQSPDRIIFKNITMFPNNEIH
jgi:NADP-dependent 3-hydroxy acid dehydrogenase YdfG